MKSLTWINKISLHDQNFKITCEKFEKNFWKKKIQDIRRKEIRREK